ncbi:MAG: circadian clock protein KaiA [Synechococcus sp.]
MTPPPLRICCYQPDDWSLNSHLEYSDFLDSSQFSLEKFRSLEHLIQHLKQREQHTDCLLLSIPKLQPLIELGDLLANQGLLLPAVALVEQSAIEIPDNAMLYHKATITLPIKQDVVTTKLDLATQIERAIALFLQLSPQGVRPVDGGNQLPTLVQQQQRKLSEKLRERLGYSGVYYKRQSDRFYRHLPKEEQVEFMSRLKELYRTIVLEYFHSPNRVNPIIDEFVALAFLGDLSVSQVLELHMQLMDNFAKQLKLEGRSEEIILDYRITLIDVIAHLSEMYRRSIPHSPQPNTKRKGGVK